MELFKGNILILDFDFDLDSESNINSACQTISLNKILNIALID